MYEAGQAIYENKKRANILYRIAANAGDVKSLYLLGLNYLNGIGVEANRSEARRLLELATVKGVADAEQEYLKVVDAKLVLNAISGVVGWQRSFEVPQFLIDADAAADQKDKDDKVAAKKAEKKRQEEEAKRKIRNIHLCRGLWWLLFRAAAAATFFSCFADAYDNIPTDDVAMLAVSFFIASYALRPKFGGVGYFFIGIAVAVLPHFAAPENIRGDNAIWNFSLFTLSVTFFMRWMGEKLKLPLLTYPILGAMVGFITSPFPEVHNCFEFDTMVGLAYICLPFLMFFVNMGMSGNNGNRIVAEGERKTSWKGTFWLLAICGAITAFLISSAGKVERKAYDKQNAKESEVQVEETKDLSLYERGIKHRDGDGVKKDLAKAKECFIGAVKANDHKAEYALGCLLIDEGNRNDGLALIKESAAAGYAPSQSFIGMELLSADKVDEGIKMLKLAADGGQVEAMKKVGDYYSEELGIFKKRRDKEQAQKYYKMAYDHGDKSAMDKLKQL